MYMQFGISLVTGPPALQYVHTCKWTFVSSGNISINHVTYSWLFLFYCSLHGPSKQTTAFCKLP